LSTEAPLDRPLDRRFLIRGGAVLAGAAGLTAIGAAIAPTEADAADGGNVVLGQQNAAASTTEITIDGATGGSDPTLALNNANGPSLALQALDEEWEGPLGVGEIVNTAAGPKIGVDYGDGAVTTFVATGVDLTNVYPLPAQRLLDTRSSSGRANVVGSSSAPFDAAGRLKRGAYIDVAIAATEDVALIGVFVNLTAFESTAGGFLEIYTPPARPGYPSLRFPRNVAVANQAFVGPEISGGAYTVRIYASQPTQVLLDLVGAVTGFAPTGPSAAKTSATARRLANRQAKQRDRLVKSIRSR
jgi:hypothetical protein